MPATTKAHVARLMLANRRVSDHYQYTVPSPSSYPYQWLWDSCFHAIILSHLEPAAAKAELRTLVSRQFHDGMIPHMIYWERPPLSSFPAIPWGKRGTSSITQPPMVAYAALQIYQADKDKAFLREMYPAMRRFYAFFFSQRDPRGHRLVGIINPDESGEDNSPRFDPALHLPPQHSIELNFQKRVALITRNRVCHFSTDCMDNFYWVRDVPFNAILVRNLRSMREIAELLGHHHDAHQYIRLAEEVTNAMREAMLRPDGVMLSTYGRNYRKIPVLTWAIFVPLFAHILTPDEAKTLINEHFLNKKEFATPYGVPTVALNEASYDPMGFWRGPVWIGANWFVYHGLKDYGYHELAAKLAAESEGLVAKSGFREYYNPTSGEGYGARDFTWPGLLLDMRHP